MLYLASPYTHSLPAVRQARYEAARLATASLMLKGLVVYSPIVHGHEMAEAHDLPTDWGFWWRHCLGMLAKADRMAVLMLDGWRESKGVRAEIDWWKERHVAEPTYMTPEDC